MLHVTVHGLTLAFPESSTPGIFELQCRAAELGKATPEGPLRQAYRDIWAKLEEAGNGSDAADGYLEVCNAGDDAFNQGELNLLLKGDGWAIS